MERWPWEEVLELAPELSEPTVTWRERPWREEVVSDTGDTGWGNTIIPPCLC